jgi:hypothetical protein
VGLGYCGNAIRRVEQDATCRGRESACDVYLGCAQVLVAASMPTSLNIRLSVFR